MASTSLFVAVLTVQLLDGYLADERVSLDSTNAFKYFYPLVLVNLTRTSQLQEYVAAGAIEKGVNLLAPARTPPDSNFTQIVKANVDTLYITAWLDLKVEPLVLGVPEIIDRFYMVQLMDAWSNSFESLGTRTRGTKAGHFAICGPGFQGSIPDGVQRLDSPTEVVWLLTRIQTLNDRDDLTNVHGIQNKFSLSLLSEWVKTGDDARRPFVPDHTSPNVQKPPEIVDSWTAKQYFTYAAEVMKTNSPPSADADMLKSLESLGIQSGTSLQWDKLSYYQQGQLRFGKAAAKASLAAAQLKIRTVKNGWQGLPNTIGDYGNDYDTRAAVAGIGLGANKAVEACYRVHDFKGGSSYKITFPSGQSPPVHAFWSFTAYTQAGYLVPNTISRYSRGSDTGLHEALDGSVTIYMQEKMPTDGMEAMNWLPIPSDGANFVVTARFYYPGEAILNGSWTLPAVQVSEDNQMLVV